MKFGHNSDVNKEFLANYVPFLLNRAARKLTRGVDEEFRRRGLTVSKWRTLAVLADRGSCRFLELAELTSIEPPTLSRFVDSLETERLIRRKRSKVDARTVTISLTARGEERFASTLPWAMEAQNAMVKGLNAEDVRQFVSALNTIYHNLQSHGPDHISDLTGKPSAKGGRRRTSTARSAVSDRSRRPPSFAKSTRRSAVNRDPER